MDDERRPHEDTSGEDRRGDSRRLDALLDGELGPAERRRLEARLAADPELRRELDDLRRLARRTSELPREVDPPADLWPAIVARLDAPAPGTEARARPRERVARPGPRRRFGGRLFGADVGWGRQALAALLCMALGGVLTYVALGGVDAGTRPAAPPVAVSEAGEELASAHEAGEGLVGVEVDYLRAKEDLWLAAYARRDELSPATWAVVERNLRILDQAIRELRRALEEDPGNPQLEELLLDNHRRGVSLLQRLSEEA